MNEFLSWIYFFIIWKKDMARTFHTIFSQSVYLYILMKKLLLLFYSCGHDNVIEEQTGQI